MRARLLILGLLGGALAYGQTNVTGQPVRGMAADNGTNSTAKVPTLPCRANTAAPTWTDGRHVPCSVDGAGNLRITGAVVGTGTAGSPAGNILTVQGVASMTKLLVTPDSVALPANQSVNVNQWAGTAIAIDPCFVLAKTVTPISLTANTQIITGTSAKQTHICAINIGPIGTATNVALVEGTGTVCATGIAGMAGGTTAANGWNIAANSGIVHGAGLGTVYKTATTADNVCLLVSAANQISGNIVWVQN